MSDEKNIDCTYHTADLEVDLGDPLMEVARYKRGELLTSGGVAGGG